MGLSHYGPWRLTFLGVFVSFRSTSGAMARPRASRSWKCRGTTPPRVALPVKCLWFTSDGVQASKKTPNQQKFLSPECNYSRHLAERCWPKKMWLLIVHRSKMIKAYLTLSNCPILLKAWHAWCTSIDRNHEKNRLKELKRDLNLSELYVCPAGRWRNAALRNEGIRHWPPRWIRTNRCVTPPRF